MPAAKKLTELEQFFFDQNYHTLPLSTLAEKLNRPEKFLKKLVDKKNEEVERAPEPVAQPVEPEVKPPPPSAFNRLVGRQKNPDGTPKKNPPIVMTEAASMVADDFLKNGKSGGLNPRLASSVFRMRDE